MHWAGCTHAVPSLPLHMEVDTGLNRSVEMAYLSFLALCNSLITRLAPGWTLVHPSAVEINIPIHRILISQ